MVKNSSALILNNNSHLFFLRGKLDSLANLLRAMTTTSTMGGIFRPELEASNLFLGERDTHMTASGAIQMCKNVK